MRSPVMNRPATASASAETASDAMSGATVGGSEPAPLTLPERIAARLPLPYPAAALLFGFVVAPPWPSIVSPSDGPRLLASVINPHMAGIHDLVDLLATGLLFCVVLYVTFAQRFVRRRVAQLRDRLPELVASPDPSLDQAYRRIGMAAPVLIASLAGLVVILGLYATKQKTVDVHLAWLLAADTVIWFLRFLTVFSAVWTYASSIRWLAGVAHQPLRLVPYYSDPLLGMRPLGALSLSLAGAFFVGVGVAPIFLLLTNATVLLLVPPIAVITIGLLLFMLPLRDVHNQMAAEKRAERSFLNETFSRSVRASRHAHPRGPATLDDIRNATAFETVERRINGIRTWPFDTGILARLTTSLAVPLILTLAGRELIALLLHL